MIIITERIVRDTFVPKEFLGLTKDEVIQRIMEDGIDQREAEMWFDRLTEGADLVVAR